MMIRVMHGLIVLPYVKGTAEQLKRILYNNFKVAMRPTLTLRNMLMKPKETYVKKVRGCLSDSL